MGALHPLILASIVVFAAAVIGGLVAVLVRALRLWRTFKAFRRLLDDATADTAARVARDEGRLAGPGNNTHQLELALARLRVSVSRAAVLGRAAASAWSLVTRIRAVVPSK
jgi:hypothetical protein